MGAFAVAGFCTAVEDIAADLADVLRAFTTACAARVRFRVSGGLRLVLPSHRLAEDVGDLLGDRAERPCGRCTVDHVEHECIDLRYVPAP